MRAVRGRCATLAAVAALAVCSAGGRSHATELEEVVLEPPSPRQGYYLSLGLHGFSALNWDEGDALGPWFGFGNAIRVGQMFTRRLGLGLGIDSGNAAGEGDGRDQKAAMSGLSLEGQLLLADRLALHGGLGVGFSQVTFDKLAPREDEELRGAAGAYFLFGATYDFFPYRKKSGSGGLAVSPGVRVRYIPGDDAHAIGIFFGVDVSIWTGLPKNQLDLPPDKAFDRRR